MTTKPTDPVAALRLIAFLLERRLADSYRIKAYRGAAASLLTQSPDEVRARAEAGTPTGRTAVRPSRRWR